MSVAGLGGIGSGIGSKTLIYDVDLFLFAEVDYFACEKERDEVLLLSRSAIE